MFCESCGKEICDNVKYCRYCGAASKTLDTSVKTDAYGDNRLGNWRRFPMILGLLVFASVVLCFFYKPDPIFLLFTYPVPAVIGGLILVLTKKNNIIIAFILLFLSISFLLFGFIGCPPISLSGVITHSYDRFDFSTRLFFISAAAARLLLTTGFFYMVVSFVVSKFKIRQITIIAVLASIILSISIPVYTIISPKIRSTNSEDLKTVEAVEKLDPDHKVLLSKEFPPSENSMKSEFAKGESIYPQSQGLKGSARYGFRVTDMNGKIIMPLNKSNISRAVDNAWTNGSGCFNNPEHPLTPGSYKMELIIVDERDKSFITARADFTVKEQQEDKVQAPGNTE